MSAEFHVYFGGMPSKSRLYWMALIYSLPPDEC